MIHSIPIARSSRETNSHVQAAAESSCLFLSALSHNELAGSLPHGGAPKGRSASAATTRIHRLDGQLPGQGERLRIHRFTESGIGIVCSLFVFFTTLTKILAKKKIQMAGGVRQGEANPTWLKQPGDYQVCAFGAVLIGYGLIQCVIGHYNIAYNLNKKE